MTTEPHHLWDTVAARVRPELRIELERIARRQRVDLSTIIRRACLEYANRLGAALDGKPATHRTDPATAKAAALERWPRARTQRRRALEAFAAAGERGLTGDELAGAVGWPDYMTGRRNASELKLGGWLRPRRRRVTDPTTGDAELVIVTRLSIHRNPQEVLVLSAKAEARRPELEYPGQGVLVA